MFQGIRISLLVVALSALFAVACTDEKDSSRANGATSTSATTQGEDDGREAQKNEGGEDDSGADKPVAPQLSSRVEFHSLPEGWEPAEDGVAIQERPYGDSPNLTVHEYPVDDGATAREISEQGRAQIKSTTDGYEELTFEQIDAFGGLGWAHGYRIPGKRGDAARLQVAYVQNTTLFIVTSYVPADEWPELEQQVRQAIAELTIDEG